MSVRKKGYLEILIATIILLTIIFILDIATQNVFIIVGVIVIINIICKRNAFVAVLVFVERIVEDEKSESRFKFAVDEFIYCVFGDWADYPGSAYADE